MAKRQTQEQKRAKYAWECVENAEKILNSKASDYGNLARGLPSYIQTNGLGQTLAFLLGKGKYKDKVKKENPHHHRDQRLGKTQPENHEHDDDRTNQFTLAFRTERLPDQDAQYGDKQDDPERLEPR